LLQLVLGDAAARQLFVPAQGAVAPEWERAVAYGSVILLLIALPFGLWRVWREFRVRPIPVVLAIVALSYPVTLAFRLTQSGAEEASRTATFVFMGLAFVVALALMKPLSIGKRIQRPILGAFAVGAVVLVTGGIIIGTPRWGRLPGPYLPAADTRSIEPEGIDAALWARTELGPGKRIVADRIDRILMGSYGVQDPVTNYANQVRSYLPFFSPTVTPADLQILQAGHVGYLVVDLRLAGVEPLAASYFESGEPTRSQGHRIVLTVADLKKFATVPGVSLVFDSGNIQVYDVRALTSGATP
jgi:hypothetical protein